jgi:sarcosine oxidase
MYDVIIIGLGGMGSAAVYELAGAGLKVLGLEQYEPLHRLGSSFGKSRMIRKAYMEGDFYIPLLERSYEKWFKMNQAERRPIINQCGGLYVAPEDDPIVRDTLAAAKTYDIPVETLSPKQIMDRFPAFTPSDNVIGVFEPSAGYVNPDATLLLYQTLAKEKGADLNFNEAVDDIKLKENFIEVKTGKETYRAGKLVVTAGAWLKRMLVYIGRPLPLEIRRMVLHWFEPSGSAGNYMPGNFVPNLWRLADGHILYGFPWTEEEEGIKYAFHDRFEIVGNLTEINREVRKSEIRGIRKALKGCAPTIPHRHIISKVCFYTMTPDEHFVIGPIKGEERVIVAGGFSGHGFKFVPVIGEILRDFACEKKPGFDMQAFSPERFQT